jgi:hypothetical protein
MGQRGAQGSLSRPRLALGGYHRHAARADGSGGLRRDAQYLLRTAAQKRSVPNTPVAWFGRASSTRPSIIGSRSHLSDTWCIPRDKNASQTTGISLRGRRLFPKSRGIPSKMIRDMFDISYTKKTTTNIEYKCNTPKNVAPDVEPSFLGRPFFLHRAVVQLTT